jgi:serine O-acetyltransferase
MFSRLRGDFNRHERKLGNMAVWVLAVYRYGRWAKQLPQPLRFAADRVYHALNLGIQITTGSFIPREVEIGEAPHLVHHFDIRIHPKVIGIMHEVTIATTMHRLGAPTIGNDVFIGAGAKIIGPVKVGDGAIIAPNSLVIADVPPGATAMGVPAKAVKIQLETKSEWTKKPGVKAI